MKGKNLFITALLALVAGLLILILYRTLSCESIVIGAGLVFVLAGVLNMTVFLGSRNRSGEAKMGAFSTAFGWVASSAAVVLGLAMLIFGETFSQMVSFMFAVLVLFAACFQLFLLIFGCRPAKLPAWFFLLPAALTGIAVYIWFQKPGFDNHAIMIWTGVGFTLFGLGTLIESIFIGNFHRKVAKAQKEAAKQVVQEQTQHKNTDIKPDIKDDTADSK